MPVNHEKTSYIYRRILSRGPDFLKTGKEGCTVVKPLLFFISLWETVGTEEICKG